MTDPLHEEIARRVAAAMKRKKWSINKLADFAGMGRGHVSEILSGKTSPTVRSLAKIADALDVELRDLLPTRSEAE